MTIAERAEAVISHVCATHFPDYLPPPEPGRKGYDPLLHVVHYATAAISWSENWAGHIAECGPHEAATCAQCVKFFNLIREHLDRSWMNAGYTLGQFTRCRRDGCGHWFRPIKRPQYYCSAACRQAAYKARKAADGG